MVGELHYWMNINFNTMNPSNIIEIPLRINLIGMILRGFLIKVLILFINMLHFSTNSMIKYSF